MDMDAAAKFWSEDGFVILPGYLPAELLAPAIDELELMFPTGDDFHDGVNPDRNARFMGEDSTASTTSRSPASSLLGTPDIRLYSAEA